MRGLWSLPRAAPALMRHIGAYVELAGLDLARTQREIMAQVVASAVVAICALFAVFMICLGVIAYTWNTPYRLAAIAWMAGGFIVVAIGAALYRARAARERSPMLADVHREWQEDRVLLERILSADGE
ncbi:MAG TPA: phage holin family protein [Steroidobacteraceae bacterium]|nr:phage holin family protein [Steroidobacteraceae bacterium]